MQTLIIDNGGYSLKAGIDECRVIPNCFARDRDKRVYVGSQLEQCKDFGDMVFRRPVEKGYIVSWEAEREIWEQELHCDPHETRLILTEAPNALPALQTNCDQMVFEEFGFASYYRCIGPVLNAYNDISGHTPAEILLAIDSGYSHTTVTPLLQGRPIQAAIRRLDVGGKLLTNYLTRLLSLRHFDMRNETHLVNEIKEATCYISQDFEGDLEKCWRREVAVEYVLPDYHHITRGYVRTTTGTEDAVTLRNERFTVPEVLFNPMDVGLRQPGLAQVVMNSLSAVPIGLWPGLLSNILVVGGNAKMDGFIQRLYTEIRQLAPSECIVRVVKPPDPVVSTWQGGVKLAESGRLPTLAVTKQEYDEGGSAWVAKKFRG